MRTSVELLVYSFAIVLHLAECSQRWTAKKTRMMEFGPDTRWCGPITQCGHLHTMCDFPFDKPSEDCQNYSKINLTSKYKLMILHFLNYRRNLVAGGNEYKLPSASGMRMLQWDDTLASFAQRWVDQCIYHFSVLKYWRPLTDFCRDHPHYQVVQYGMVILGYSKNDDWSIMDLITFMVNWISSDGDRVANHVLHSGYIPFEDDGAIVFYAPAYKIGCGSAAYDVYSTNSSYYDRLSSLICNLGPVKNLYLQDKYYKTGAPCSECPDGSACIPNSNFKYLCQSIDSKPVYDDDDDDEEVEEDEATSHPTI